MGKAQTKIEIATIGFKIATSCNTTASVKIKPTTATIHSTRS
jgi:hypothetical protein